MEERKNPSSENIQENSMNECVGGMPSAKEPAPVSNPLAWNEPDPFAPEEPKAPQEEPRVAEPQAVESQGGEPQADAWNESPAPTDQPIARNGDAQENAEEPRPASAEQEPIHEPQPAAAQVPPAQEQTPPQAGWNPPQQAAFWQSGGYTYQNPNPYQNYQWQMPPQQVKKDRNRPFVIAVVVAVVIIALCCLAVVMAEILSLSHGVENDRPQSGIVETPYTDDDEREESQEGEEDTAQRQEGAVYNAPEISTEKKKGEALSLVDINKKVKDSVVGILITEKQNEEAEFSGSGFIISEDGYIITNEHVVSNAAQVKVVLSDGITEYQAVIVGKDSQADLAILKVEAKGLAAAVIGDSDELEVGETVVAIGNPYGMVLAGSLTDGIVSALNRKIEINGSFMTLIQTNASINPGNSGGPLVNAYGQVVGICSSKLVATDYEGIGFAIPINDVVNLADELINYGHIRTRAYIGIMGYDLHEDYCKYHGIPQGVYVSYVDPECEAAKKGMKEGDIIIGFNGEELTSMAQLNELKNEFRPGDTVKVKVWRNEKELEFEITLQESDD